MSGEQPVAPEFSRIVDLEELDAPETLSLEASEDERRALAARFDQPAIDVLSAEVTLCWLDPGKVLSLSGRFSASLTQTCVVSLEPVAARIDEELDLVYARDFEESADIVDPDDAEPLEGGTIDVGEIVATEFSLSIDPYPRQPDIDASAIDLGPGATLMDEEEAGKTAGKTNPFAVLADLKPKP